MRRLLMFWVFLLGLCATVSAIDDASRIRSMLLQEGMENVRCLQTDDALYIAFEDRADRQPWLGLVRLIRFCRDNGIDTPISVNLEQGGVARVNLAFEGELPVQVTNQTHSCERMLRQERGEDRSYGKLLVTALPVFAIRNARTDVIFTTFFGIAPTLQMEVWKGGVLTAQVILPIQNSMEKQFDYIRPGFMTFSQRFKIGNGWELVGSIGNFTNQRAGIHGWLGYRLPNGRWGISAEGGLTGSSTTWGGQWRFSQWRRVDFAGSMYYYFAGSNTKLEGSIARYVMGDYGVRGELSRRFRNVTVGLYGMISDGEINGGFNFIVPLTFTRLKRIRPVSVVWPQWYDWQYSAQSGPEYVARGLGKQYLSRLYERADHSYWNPLYIESQIIHLLNIKSK